MSESIGAGYDVHRPEDRELMLEAIGLASIDELFAKIPRDLRLQRLMDLPPPLSEWELDRHVRALASANATTLTHLSLLGGGAYDHHVPAVVSDIASRGEFLTSYTPYQPEMSQGMLRVLHDFQLLLGRLLGLPRANSSVYDGATALAEAAWMACSIRQVPRIAVAETIWPEWRAVLDTYMDGRGVTIHPVAADPDSGLVAPESLERTLARTPMAALVVQTPNMFGVVESIRPLAAICKAHGALTNVSCYPMLLGLVQSPGEQGADIATCEAQSLGLWLNAGGPYLGVIATRDEYELFLPGRIVGECDDLKGEPALALVKEQREQHVSRDKATSHICSNQALMALRAVVYLSTVGEGGFRRLSRLNAQKAHYLCDRLCSLPGVALAKSGRFFNEFLLSLPGDAASVLRSLRDERIFGGIDFAGLDPRYRHHLLVAVTETRSKGELDRIVAAFARALSAAPRVDAGGDRA
ncbi:MAG: aminomethyl-transferring glycine dehydrogenase subunit GcvPA [Candidatus Riflebacteria bacterium]|nr:aminomethyl-transferring glycine dehydrogenase subunit GcvPA [Candidatus Riflebacteria bacterium]